MEDNTNQADPTEAASVQVAGDVSNTHRKVFDSLNKVLKSRLGTMNMAVWVTFDLLPTPQLYEVQNICHLMAQFNNVPAKIYFPIDQYPTTPEGKDKLLDALRLSAHHGEDKLISGGGAGKRKRQQHEYVMICQRGRPYLGDKYDSETKQIQRRADYLQASISNPRNNCRHGPQGKNGSRRTTTSRCLGPQQPRCQFSLSIYKDRQGYYIKTRVGNPYHQFHPPRQMNIPTRLLEDNAKELIHDMNSARAATGVAASIHYARSNREGMPTLLSHNQIRYIMKRKDRLDEEEVPLENEDQENQETSISGLYRHMEREGYQYVSLIDKRVGPTAFRLFNEKKDGKKLVNQVPLRDTQTEELTREATQVAAQHRRSRGIGPSQDMMVALAYTSPLELRQFRLFHAVLHVDGTSHTNKEQRPLVAVTTKDSRGKMLPILRAFLPSEQAWAFQWLFSSVFPMILGEDMLKRVNMIITDGDAQLTSQLDLAIQKYFPGCHRQRCTWHVIDRGILTHLKCLQFGGHGRRKRHPHLKHTPRPKPKPLTTKNKVARYIYRWMFSWAWPGYCITETEYALSKALFVRYVTRPSIQRILGGSEASKQILEFCSKSVFVLEQHTCFHLRQEIFHLESHCNSGHEGVNNGLKNSAIPVQPSHRLDESFKTMHQMSQLKAMQTQIEVSKEQHDAKLWSDSPSSPHLTKLGEALVSQEFGARKNWKHIRTAKDCWLVLHKDEKLGDDMGWKPEALFEDEEVDETGCETDTQQGTHSVPRRDVPQMLDGKVVGKFWGPIPRFRRVYSVLISWSDKKQYRCSCYTQQRMGFPCRHIACVLAEPNQDGVTIIPDMKGFPVCSIRVFWWSHYYKFGMLPNAEYKKVVKTMMDLDERDTQGIVCLGDPADLPGRIREDAEAQLAKDLAHSDPVDRLLNYTPDQGKRALGRCLDQNIMVNQEYFVPPNCTQLSHLTQDSLESSLSDDQPDDQGDNHAHQSSSQFEVTNEEVQAIQGGINNFLIEKYREERGERGYTSDEGSETLEKVQYTGEVAHLDGDLRHPRNQLVGTFNAMCDTIAMSECKMRGNLMKQSEDYMNNIIAQARAHPAIPQKSIDNGGTMVSMIPASNQKRSNNVNKT